ncbi:rod shape-determining protein RodA [Fusobacterium sp. IOR10]|uniref:rod shape-determining protein RodA n=1 Tax=Fusobacterium sp. IOR10 TaxID=2665157 RepID=UPI0013D8749A|nr:rod shape-determining protein RodA [Fusobacterium sp. IOR10]
MNKRDILVLQKKIKKADYSLLLKVLLLIVISLSTVYTATSYRTLVYFKKEIIWSGLGLLVYFFVSLIDYKKYAKYYKLIYIFNVLMLISVFIFGDSAKGAKRWINLGIVNIQPAEFAKLLIILTFAEVLIINYNKNFNGIKNIIFSFCHIVPIFLLIAKQPDLGTSLVIIFIYGVMIFVHGIDFKTIFKLMIGVITSIPLFYFFLLRDYQKKRILTFLNPEADLANSGWNVVQSKIAIGSGGFLGKGFLQGTQSKLRFLPESHTDFIGSVFLEERGFIGGMILIVIYLALIFNILKIADSTSDEYGKLICYGIASIFFFHTFINLGMIMGIMPVTGLPLLFMSYGGSSFIFGFLMIGVVNSVKIHKI